MFEELLKLVNSLPDDKKSEFIKAIGQLQSQGLTVLPKNLDDLLKDEKFADLAKQVTSKIDSEVGKNRTKWEKEVSDKKEPENKEEGKETKMSPEFEAMLKEFKEIKDGMLSLQNQSKVKNLNAYLDEKTKGYPEQMKALIDISENTTQEQIDQKIEALNKVFEISLNKDDQTPILGQEGKITDVEFDKTLKEFGDSIPTQTPIKQD